MEPCSCGKHLPSHPLGIAVPLRRKRLAASAAGGATAFAQPKPVGAQYRTHSLRRQKRQAGQPPGIQQEEMKRRQPGIRLRRDSRSGRESPRLLPFPARFSFPCWPYRDGGFAALAPLRGAKATAAAAPAYPGGQGQPRTGHDQWRAGLTPPSLAQRLRENAFYQGASGGPDSAANRAAGRADTPRWRAVV